MQKGDCILEWILAYKVKKKIKDIEMVSDLIMKEKFKKKKWRIVNCQEQTQQKL